MKRLRIWGTTIVTIVVLALPFVGGSGPGLTVPAHADALPSQTIDRSNAPVGTAGQASGTLDRRAEYAAAGQSCPAALDIAHTGLVGGTTSPLGVGGTTQDDLDTFAAAFNAIRIENCLEPIPFDRFTWDSCMEHRLFWMAEDPSTDPLSAWGHLGSERSDGLPSVGCDGNLAGGPDNTGSTVAYKWWVSDAHRASLYRPGSESGGACIAFAMTHGGVPNEAASFTRAAARWYDC
ncbi:hypothetical protein BH11ACT5_BH11ACT5_21640 [soil metagenome]